LDLTHLSLDSAIVFRNTCEARGCPTISIGPEMVWWHRAEPTVCDDAAASVTNKLARTARTCGKTCRPANPNESAGTLAVVQECALARHARQHGRIRGI
jgi:hypothetical protein